MADSGQSCAAALCPAATSAVRDKTSCSASNTVTRALRSTVKRVGREQQDGEHDGQTAADQSVVDAFGTTPLRYRASTRIDETTV